MTAARSGRGRAAPRARRGRQISLAVALLLALAALVVGVLVGYAAHGDDGTGRLITETREVPVVTVTVPASR